jgi:hypothetical protein
MYLIIAKNKMNLTASRLLLTSITRRQLLPPRSGFILRSVSTSVATDSTAVCQKSTDPEWIKMAVQQMLQHCDNNNINKCVGTNTNTTASSAFVDGDATNFKKKVVSDEDLEKALQSYKVCLSTTPHVEKNYCKASYQGVQKIDLTDC